MHYRLTSAACALLVLLSGCYRYAAVDPPASASGSEVRLYLTPDGSERVAASLGPQTTVVAGRVDGGASDQITLVVSSTTKSFGGSVRWMGERVTIPLGLIARTERRVLDRRRTGLVGGAVVVATVAGYALLRAVNGNGSGDSSEPPTPAP